MRYWPYVFALLVAWVLILRYAPYAERVIPPTSYELPDLGNPPAVGPLPSSSTLKGLS